MRDDSHRHLRLWLEREPREASEKERGGENEARDVCPGLGAASELQREGDAHTTEARMLLEI